jgi:hypothetical protein
MPTPSDYTKAFNPALSHHRAWLQQALERLNELDPQALQEGELRELWLAAVETKAPLVVQQPECYELPSFPYFYQTDNGETGWRECQTSAIAMCLKYIGVKGIKDDTNYLRIVNRYGDTTEQAAHKVALSYLGVKARFTTSATDETITKELAAGRPIAVGIEHNGPVSSPDPNSGHWIVIYGATRTQWKVMDPFGEADLVNGGFVARGKFSGKSQLYSKANFAKRWRPGGGATGWAWLFPSR